MASRAIETVKKKLSQRRLVIGTRKADNSNTSIDSANDLDPSNETLTHGNGALNAASRVVEQLVPSASPGATSGSLSINTELANSGSTTVAGNDSLVLGGSPTLQHRTTAGESQIPVEELAMLLTSRRTSGNNRAPGAAKPRLEVSESGKFQDQFFHAQDGSRTVGMLKNRLYAHKTPRKGSADLTKTQRKRSLGKETEQFSEADIVYAGYLIKQGSFWKNWRKRYFILRRDCPVLSYYTSLENLTKLGEITIDGTSKVETSGTAQYPQLFAICHGDRRLLLMPEDQNQQVTDKWVNCLSNLIQKRANDAALEATLQRSGVDNTNPSSISICPTIDSIVSAGDSMDLSNGMDSVIITSPPAPVAQPLVLSPRERRFKTRVFNMKRFSTDTILIRAAAEQARRTANSEENLNNPHRRDPRANGSALDGSFVSKPITAGRRLQRSKSAGSAVFRGLLKNAKLQGADGSSQRALLRESHSSEVGILDESMASRSRSLSLPRLRPAPSVELAVSVASKGAQDTSHMVIVLSTVQPDGSMTELGRTEYVGTFALRSCGGDYVARDFSALLSVPLNTRSVLHFEMFSVLNVASESLATQQSLGFVRVSPLDVLFSRDSTLILEIFCDSTNGVSGTTGVPAGNPGAPGAAGTSSTQYYLMIDRILSKELLMLGHGYVYARRHFVADAVQVEKRKVSSPEMPTSAPVFRQPQLLQAYGRTTSSTSEDSDKSLASNANGAAKMNKKVSGNEHDAPERLAHTSVADKNVLPPVPSHILISEELSASYCSISVAVAYMKLLQQRNQRRIHDTHEAIAQIEKNYEQTPSSPNRKTQSSDTINLHSEMVRDMRTKLMYHSKLYEIYVRCEQHYIALLAMLEDGKEPGITGCLKRSTMKKDKLTEFMPVNLNCHVVRAKRTRLFGQDSTADFDGLTGKCKDISSSTGCGSCQDELVHAVITHGCAAAHALGFKEGGLRRLVEAAGSEIECYERIEQRQDVVRCQMLSIVSSAFLTVISLAWNGSCVHRESLKMICQAGFLINTESLLSTMGSEKGMLEDLSEGMRWVNDSVYIQVVQSMEVNRLNCWKCIGVTASVQRGKDVVATFALPTEVFMQLPLKLQQGQPVKVYGALFTQGINEMQSVANTMLDTSLQDDINYENGMVLQKYFQIYMDQFRLAYLSPDPRSTGSDNDGNCTVGQQVEPTTKISNVQSNTSGIPDAAQRRLEELSGLQQEITSLVERLRELRRKGHTHKKNVNVLIESSSICRRLGAGRTTCCKSGKDRTAMSVTLESSRLLVDHFQVRQGVMLCHAMRERGVRRVNVFVNTGKNRYAFNNFQVKCLPDCYKPPLSSIDPHVES